MYQLHVCTKRRLAQRRSCDPAKPELVVVGTDYYFCEVRSKKKLDFTFSLLPHNSQLETIRESNQFKKVQKSSLLLF